MASRKTWIWIIVGIFGTCVLLLLVIAGAGIYFVSNHISTKHTSSTDAFQTFDAARARFKGQAPLLEVDNNEHPRVTKPLTSFPTSPDKPQDLYVLAWDPDDERVVQVALPFWLLKMGRRKVNVMSGSGSGGFDFDRLNIDIRDLERIGPMLVLDMRGSQGERVLVWTK
jgi:hypothetical protein